MENKLKVGDRVRIIDLGQFYSGYEKMAKKLNAISWVPEKYPKGRYPVGIIKNIKKEFQSSIDIALVEIDNFEYLFRTTGLKLIKSKPLGNTIRGDGEFVIKDSGKRVNYKSGFIRDTDENKPFYDLIPFAPLKRLAMHFTNGAKKYGENNWQKANSQEEYERFKRSAWRHLAQWSKGDKDEDHASAVIWNIMAYEWHIKHKNERKDI